MRLMLLSTVLAVVAWNQAVFSAPAKGCSYSPLQQVIRTARTDADILKLIDNQVNLNIKPRCGGNVMQLAILRGNPSLVKILIDQGGLDLNELVSNADYPIPGAPKEIPLIFFAAYYSPRIEIMNLLLNANTEVLKTDSRGETILWYLDKNPVLMNTELVDNLTQQLIMADTRERNNSKELDNGRTKNERANDETDNSSPKQQISQRKQERRNFAQKQQEKSDFGVVESEPDNPYKPNDNGINQTDF